MNCIAIQGDYVWFGSDAGTSVYDQKRGYWLHFTEKDGLSSNRITSIAIDGKDAWVGTLDSGVSRYNKHTDIWTTYTEHYESEDI